MTTKKTRKPIVRKHKKNKLVLKPKKPIQKETKVEEPLFEDYFDFNTFKKTPVSVNFIMRKARELVNWARNDEDALIISQFYVKHGLSGKCVKRWGERCPEWKEALKIAKVAIGTRREVGAMKKIYSEGMVKNSLPFYGESWTVGEDYKKLEEWRAELRKIIAESKTSGDVHVHMDSFIPDKKDNNG